MLEKLWAKDSSDYDYWNGILKNQLLSKYLVNIKSQNDKLAKLAEALDIEVCDKVTQKLELTEKTEIISSENNLISTVIKEQNLCDEDCETCDEMNKFEKTFR